MKWNELKKQALQHGFELSRHGKGHDIYVNHAKGITIQIERHGNAEVKKGLYFKLKKQIGF